MPGCTMWVYVSSAKKVSMYRVKVLEANLLSVEGRVITLCPKASTAPASCTPMWPVSTQTTPSQPRRRESMTVVLVCVPPTRKYTSALSMPTALRIFSFAASV